MENTFNLFVYGTLLPNEGNFRLIDDLVLHQRPATVEGVLMDLGAFPALIEMGGTCTRGAIQWSEEMPFEN